MAEEGFKRKLTAILSADVIGYSRLMRDDEEATVRDLAAHRVLITEIIQQQNGRVVDSPGDNILAEFASVVDAVNGAIKIQDEIQKSNADTPEDRRMEFRIGINLGDVIEEDERIYGDGVNIAARVEGLAAGGGIAISGTVYEHIKEKLSLGYHYLGEQNVKNISEPVRVYRLLTAPDDAGKMIVEKKPKSKKLRWTASGAIALIILMVGAVAIWNYYFRVRIEPASLDKMAYPLPEKPSIAVLPFDNISSDKSHDYFGDGITEEIISALSKIPKLFVIARNSVFTYKGKPVKVQQVAEDLGVRYVLEGSVRIVGDQARITAQLIDATTGHHLWSERYDRKMEDVFAIQDEITLKIVAALQVELTEGEHALLFERGTSNLSAYLKGIESLYHYRRFTKVGNAKARQLGEEVISIDPDYPVGWTMVAWTHLTAVWYGWSKTPKEDMDQVLEITQKLRDLGEYQGAHYQLGCFYLLTNQHEKAVDELKKALEFVSADSSDINVFLGTALTYSGKANEAIEYIKKGMRLNPMYPAWYLHALSRAYRLTGEYHEAIKASEELLGRKVLMRNAHLHLAISYIMLGEDEKAQFHVREILRLNPKYSIKNYAMTNPFKDRAILDRDTSALRKAGLPEHPPLKLPDKPSIAVLPFVNMSGDPEQEYFSDGLTDELIGDLAKISGILVISRNSAFTYKGKQVKIAQIARELNVRYVLEGSVQKSGDRVRIRSQLIEGQTDHHLWAESYDGVLNDIFDLQDKITSKIVSALKVKLSVGEQELVDRKDTENIKAYDTFLKGWSYYRRNTPEDWGKAISHFVNAVELDPDYNRAYEAIALIYWRYTRTLRPSFYQESELNVNFFEARARAREYLKLARRKPGSIYFRVEASMALYRRQYAKALTEAEHAVDLDPNDVDGIYTLAYILLAIGKTDRAVELINKGMRLDPNNIAGPLYLLGIAHFAKGQLKETVSMIERALIHNPELPRPAPILPAALAHLGQVSKAKSTLENIKKDGTANFNFNTIMFNFPFQNPEVLHRLADGIRKAGLPAVDFKYYKFLPEERLDEDDIKNLIFGQKVTAFWLQKGARLWIERTEDGHARLSMVPGLTNNYYDSGQSWIEGDMLCDQWQFLKGGLKHCMSVFRNPEGTHKMKNEYIAVSDFDFQLISPVD